MAGWSATAVVALLVLLMLPGSTVATSKQRRSLSTNVRPQAAARKLLQREKYPLSADPDNPGCYLYRATSGDNIDAIARDLGVSASGLRDLNSKNIDDFSRLNGRFISICNIGNPSKIEGGTGGAPPPRLSAAAPAAPPPEPPPAPKPEPKPEPPPPPPPAPKVEPPPPPPAATPPPPPSPAQPPPPSPAQPAGQTTQTTNNGQTSTTTTTTQQPQQQQQQGMVVQRGGILPFFGGMTPVTTTTNGAPAASGGRVVSPISFGFGR